MDERISYAIQNGGAVVTKSPGFISIINPQGQRTLVPREFENMFTQLFEGKEVLPKKYIFNPSSQSPPKLWIERVGGGFGDIIHCLSAIEDKVAEFKQEHGAFSRVEICVPKEHAWMLEHIPRVTIITTDELRSYSYLQHTIVDAREHIDLLCPADDYEHDSKFVVEKSRVELFYEGCKAKSKPRAPQWKPTERIENPFPKDKTVVCLCLHTADKYKDWSVDRFEELAHKLTDLGYFVFTTDQSTTFEGIPALPKMSMKEVTQHLSWADAIIAPDTGPLFIAASMGITALGLFGKTSGYQLLEKNYPTGTAIQIIKPDKCQRPCYHSKEHRGFYCDQVHFTGGLKTTCMADISVEMVLEKFLSLKDVGAFRFDKESHNAYFREFNGKTGSHR